MALINVDVNAAEAVNQAASDPDQAARALLIAAEYIRKGKPLPHPLDKFLADAIEHSMLKPAGRARNTALLRELFLEAENRRPAKASGARVYSEMNELITDGGLSQNRAAEIVAKEHAISASTAKRLYREYLKADTEARRI
jgi:hypothetical protein